MFSIRTAIFSLLLSCWFVCVGGEESIEEQEHVIQRRSLTSDALKSGVWMNQGQAWPRCSALHYQQLQCSNFSLTQAPVDQKRLWQPDCDFLMQRLLCAIYQTNCPLIGHSAFQMYDVPCQSSCYATISICGSQSSHGFNNIYNSGSFSPPSDYRRSWHVATTLSPGQSVWPWHPIRSGYRPRGLNQAPGVRRYRRSATAPIVSTTPKLGVKEDNLKSRSSRESASWLKLEASDCKYLPAGGCDNWADGLSGLHNLYVSDFEDRVQNNHACHASTPHVCKQMFPSDLKKEEWIDGNFTVALVIRVTQTFWWFGKNNRFQPFFRFHVKRTLKTDIHPYDEKIILTNAFPQSCVCPNQLTVGKRYLMLTHSKVSRQTLKISNKTVFMDRAKRYSKRVLCWLGSCPHRLPTGNRQRRYPENSQQQQHRWQQSRWQQPQRARPFMTKMTF